MLNAKLRLIFKRSPCVFAVPCTIFFLGILISFNALSDNTTLIIYDDKSFSKKVAAKEGSGTSSQTMILLFEQLESPFTLAYVPLARHSREMSQTDRAVCVLFRLKTQKRDEQYLFSRPVAFQSSHRLYMQAQLPPLPPELLNAQGSVISLKAVLDAYPNSSLVLTKGASYGTYLDTQIAKLSSKQLNLVQGNFSHGVNVKMFGYNRAEFTIVSPTEMHAYQAENQDFSYQAYSITGIPKTITSHIMCNDTQTSRKVLNEINEALSHLYKAPSFLKAHYDFQPIAEHSALTRAIDFESKNSFPVHELKK